MLSLWLSESLLVCKTVAACLLHFLGSVWDSFTVPWWEGRERWEIFSDKHWSWQCSLCSLAIHPDMVTIATGQVAGTSKDGKVSSHLHSVAVYWFVDLAAWTSPRCAQKQNHCAHDHYLHQCFSILQSVLEL